MTDEAKLKEQAKRSGLSVFLLVKRLIGYGKNTGRGMCKNCEYVAIPKFKGKERMQCTVIGIGDDFYADVNLEWCCKKSFSLRPEQLKVINDFLNNLPKE